jgi:hypothetical protein
MPWSFIVPAAASLFGASQQADATQNAANITGAATDRAVQLQNEQYQQMRADQAPYRAAGQTALNALIPLATNYKKFGTDEFQQDPGYQFRLSEGQRAMARTAPNRGGLVSGNSLKAMQDYSQNYASNEYTNAFNRYQTERNAQLQPLQSLAGVGQSATNFGNVAGANNANTVGNALISQANNAANAGMIRSNAYGNAFSSIGSAYGKNPVDFRKIFNFGNTGVNGGGLNQDFGFGTGSGYGNQDFGQSL